MRSADDIRLCTDSEDIDVVLGGHDHMSKGEMIGKTVFVKSGSDFREITQIRV
jgi:5'-nucleotidase